MPITLPLEPTPPTQVNPKLLLLYGQQKIGKTTICSQLPGKYLILECDRKGEGAEYINCTRIKIPSYDSMIDTCVEVIKQNRPYKYGVLDTASTFEDLSEIDATKQYKL